MTLDTLTRADISESIYKAVGLSRKESAALLDDLLEEVIQALVQGEDVKISSFATLSVRQKKQRIGRNPRTGEEVPITPRRVLTFRPSIQLRDKVNHVKLRVREKA